MEDTVICPGLYAYSFRIDRDQEQLFQEVEWLIPQTTKYLMRREFGDETNKEHLQCILWFKNKLATKEILRIRNHFRREKGKISFISAKKVKSLAAYCNKSEGDLQTNLTTLEFSRIEKWKNLDDVWKDELHQFLRQLSTIYYCSDYGAFCNKIVIFYLENGKSPPNRNTLYKHLLNYHENYNSEQYLQDISLFSNKF